MSKQHSNKSSAVGLGSSSATAFALFGFGGHLLDVKFGTEPFYTLAGVFLALIWIFYEVWKIVRKNNENDDEKK